MLIPLYHGTSTVFLPSIEESGLGAKDPNVEFRSYDLLSDLLEIMRRSNWFDDEYLTTQEFLLQNMVNQRVTGGGFNFRYGSTYLSPDRDTAVRYASTNQYGSELLSYAVALLGRLEKYDGRLSRQMLQKYPSIANIRETEAYPVLVETTQTPINGLRSENGGDALVVINELEEWMNDTDPRIFHIVCQQSNFELVVPVPASVLTYYAIQWLDERQYTLETITT